MPSFRSLSTCLLTLGLSVTTANAQSVARTFDGVGGDLKSGDIVLVADETGETWGQVADISRSSLTVLAGERLGNGATFPKTSARTFPEAAVLAIWRSDSERRKGDQIFSLPVRSFGDLPRALEVGDFVTIVEPDGRVSRGRLAAVSPTELTLRESGSVFRLERAGTPAAPPVPRTFSAAVASVAKGGDRLWNGVAIGAGVGLGLGVASIASATGDASDGYAALPALAATGAGVGLLIDWTINRKKTVWSADRSGTRPSAALAPILRRDAKGLALALRF